MGIEPTERLTDVPLSFEDWEEHQHLSRIEHWREGLRAQFRMLKR